MGNLCVIPARGGSKRIPRKNIKNFLGRPIISYSIEAALKSNLYEEVMVSTDDLEIADIAKQYGASVPFLRSEENSNDYATTVDVLLEVIHLYEKENIFFDIATCIYPTAPFCSAELLQNSLNILVKQKVDSVFPVVRYGHPIQRALNYTNDGLIKMIDASKLSVRSQDLTPTFHDAGQFYTFCIKKFKKQKSLMPENSTAIEISELKVQDIDNEVDWKLAEIKYVL